MVGVPNWLGVKISGFKLNLEPDLPKVIHIGLRLPNGRVDPEVMHMRLETYLVQNDLVGREQIQEAIEYQRTHGGSLATHLFRFGYVDESDLVAGLAAQFGCDGIRLSGMDISEDTLGLVSVEAVRDQCIIPFEYDHSNRIVKIACEDPDEESLRETLAKLLPDKTAELYVSLGTTLRLSILKHYRQALRPSSEIEPDRPEETIPKPFTGLESVAINAASEDVPEPNLETGCRLLLLDTATNDVPSLGQVLQYQGYLVTVVSTIFDFVQAMTRHNPHIRVLQTPGDRSVVNAILRQLADSDRSIADCPTYLIIDHPEKQEIGDLLRAGFEDVISSDNVLDLMMIKLKQTRDRIFRERRRRQDFMQQVGTHGSLDDMNIIDLLQALGPTSKTARLSVTGQGQQLTVYLDSGQIIYADCDDVFGADAVYCALAWDRGVWSLDPESPEDLPEPNISQTNESILLEGCRRLDEGVRATGSIPIDDLMKTLDQYG